MSDDASTTPFELGKKLLREDRFTEAVDQFTAVLKDEPAHVEALQHRSDAFLYDAEYEKALNDVEAALAISPNNADLYLARATIRTALDEMAEILPDIETALSLSPDSVDAYAQLAAYWIARFDLPRMKEAVDRTLALEAEDPDGLLCLDTFYAWNADRNNAAETLDRAHVAVVAELKKNGRKLASLLEYAYILSSKQKNKSAFAVVKEGLERFPKLPQFYLARAAIRLERGRLSAAEKDLRHAEKRCEKHGIWNSWLFILESLLCEQRGETDRALVWLEKIFERKPNDPEGLLKRLGLLGNKILTGNDDKLIEPALKTADRLIELASQYYYPHLIRFWLHWKQGDEKKSEDDLKRARLLLPDDPEDRETAAYFLIEAGRCDIARDLLDEVLKTEPANGHAYGLRGIAWHNLGACELAVRDLSLAMELEGVDVELLNHRGLARLELGNFAWTTFSYRCAAEDFFRALNLEPERSDCWRYLGIAWFRIACRAWFGRKKLFLRSIEHYTKAIELNPGDADALQFRALSRWYLKNYDAVIDDCDEALAIAPDHIDALELRCQTYRRLGKSDKAREDYRRLEELIDAAAGNHESSSPQLPTKRIR